MKVPSGLLQMGRAAETAQAAGTMVGALPHGAYGGPPPLLPLPVALHHSCSAGVVPRPRALA